MEVGAKKDRRLRLGEMLVQHEVRRLSASILTPRQIEAYARQMMSEVQREEFERSRELDFAYTFPDIGRFRINIYRQRASVSIAIRPIEDRITPETGIKFCDNPVFFNELVGRRVSR